ncbi:hypothetical protein LCG56_28300 (plasmid) [Pseudomonas cannabina pv. alisalensis]|uniref:Uncharacterized protein n=1 Tax=Pseudomonas syringae pv. maculicola str. ES4326 TaxID=629265 RepID=A0A8T8CBU4_PSEYM|nr:MULTISPECIES: hypothetical protein [Pseudomonas syringae group]QHF00668.1 hypothetical protein PMA4326_029670 [Pseudomonas syringae pv. maculicola str. ES4326]UBZ00665.1 hypothetical protein LCG56_28300 [Pseudomonas cannabina pv. alisalensis]
MNTPPSKDALREFLASKFAETVEQNPDAVVLYAAGRAPDPKRYVKRPTVQEVAFKRELEKMRNDQAQKAVPESATSPDPATRTNHLSLDDYPGLGQPAERKEF